MPGLNTTALSASLERVAGSLGDLGSAFGAAFRAAMEAEGRAVAEGMAQPLNGPNSRLRRTNHVEPELAPDPLDFPEPTIRPRVHPRVFMDAAYPLNTRVLNVQIRASDFDLRPIPVSPSLQRLRDTARPEARPERSSTPAGS